ncbi:MAG: class IV adenylate cyclase [Acidobacteriota bacterium]|nr:class IV adenylate cyclase [Acidobacteriota bacterium]
MAGVTQETEIKLHAGDVRAARELIEARGFALTVPRVFERNTVFDREGGDLQRRGQLLRLRTAGGRATLTFKGMASTGRHKSREERETGILDAGEMAVILERLGYRAMFIYEKYRTEFVSSGHGSTLITLDETPVGNFIEIEGEASAIDEAAQLLGFREPDYLTASYVNLYAAWCRERGIPPGNMTF